MKSKLKIRATGLGLMILGGILFVVAVRLISSEWPQIFVGLASILSSAMGFGILLMPIDPPSTASQKND
jgi:hypothetical protein